VPGQPKLHAGPQGRGLVNASAVFRVPNGVAAAVFARQ